MERRPLLLAYAIIGLISIWAQSSLMREVMVIVFGTELSWGILLGSWLAGVAVGAAACVAWSRAHQNPRPILPFLILFVPAGQMLGVVLARLGRAWLQIGPGECLDPAQIAILSIACTWPACLWTGAAFALAGEIASSLDGATAGVRAAAWLYLAEAAGSLIGGLTFSLLLVEHLRSTEIAALSALIAVVCSLGFPRGSLRASSSTQRLLAFGLILTAGLVTGAVRHLDDWLVLRRWLTVAPPLTLVQSIDTRYQSSAIGSLDSQLTLYQNGLASITWPDHASQAIDAHLAASMAVAPKRALILGSGMEGALKELLQHGIVHADLVLLDRATHEMMREWLDPLDRATLDSRSVAVHFDDPRRFLERAARSGSASYDLVVLWTGEPASTLAARLYTEESFRAVKDVMSPDGVLTFRLAIAAGIWNAEAARYAGTMIEPLRRVFSDVLLTYGSPTRCFAARRTGVIVRTGAELAGRFAAHGASSPFFDPLWFDGAAEILDPEKTRSIEQLLASCPAPAMNTDSRPAAMLQFFEYWLASQGGGSNLIPWIGSLEAFEVVIAVVLITLGGVLAATAKGGSRLRARAACWSIATTGFAGIGLEIVLLYTFQVAYGYAYQMLGLVVGLYMFGLVLGAGIMAGRRSSTEALALIDIALAGGAIVILLAHKAMLAGGPGLAGQAALFASVTITGFIGGLAFPPAVSLTSSGDGNITSAMGTVASADYLGATLGAVVTGAAFLPGMGLGATCAILAVAKTLSAGWLFAVSARRV